MRVGNVMVLHRPKPEEPQANPEMRQTEIEKPH
jgi:hypothetical protein